MFRHIHARAEFAVKLLSGDCLFMKDPKTAQTLCIVGDPSIQNAQASIESEDMEQTLKNLLSEGGKIVNQNQYPTMKTASVQDPDGRAMIIWQTIS